MIYVIGPVTRRKAIMSNCFVDGEWAFSAFENAFATIMSYCFVDGEWGEACFPTFGCGIINFPSK
ncbi:hypothetical protein [Methanobrevibacter sp.]|uniref:hypothetical protein n=1 Tax=Methanobrevibacter sp. TaxID=66852 RepID=UPI00386B2738